MSAKHDIPPAPPQSPIPERHTEHHPNSAPLHALAEPALLALKLHILDAAFDSPETRHDDFADPAPHAVTDNAATDSAACNPEFIPPYPRMVAVAFKLLGLWGLPLYLALATMLKAYVPFFAGVSWLIILSPLLLIAAFAAALLLLAAGLALYARACCRKYPGRNQR